MVASPSVLIVGGGLFGLTAANALARRGCRVRVVEPGPIPYPDSASNDISKVVRMEYGADDFYSRWMLEALEGWRLWNARWGEVVFRETGVLMLSRGALEPGSFEGESLRTLQKLGCKPERMDPDTLRRRFPAWNAEAYSDGFFHAMGGYARSDRTIRLLAHDAAAAGAEFFTGVRLEAWIEERGRIRGAICGGRRLEADESVLAAGAWSAAWVPGMPCLFRTVAQPVFYLRPEDPAPYRPDLFPVFTADIKRTGWYGMPANESGVVKLANHGPGRPLDPQGCRDVSTEERERLRTFLDASFPGLAKAPVVGSKVCLYCDTCDGDFWIARHPTLGGLTVAAGGSGHAFKFAPVLGAVVADAVLGRPSERLERFGWRETGRAGRSEAARFKG